MCLCGCGLGGCHGGGGDTGESWRGGMEGRREDEIEKEEEEEDGKVERKGLSSFWSWWWHGFLC